MADFQSGFGFIGGAVGDLFSAGGRREAAGGLDKAAALAEKSAELTEYAGKIKTVQTAREAYRVIGGQRADVAAAGFAEKGSALDLLRSSSQEAALALGLVKTQANIDKNDFIAMAANYRSQAQQQRTAAQGDFFGGAIKAIAGIASFFL